MAWDNPLVQSNAPLPAAWDPWDPWDRIVVDNWSLLGQEQQGSEGAQWLEDPEGRHWLHKDVVIKSGFRQGEDWSEVMSSAVAFAMGASRADTRLCRRCGRDGSLSLSVKPLGYNMFDGGVWLDGHPKVQGYLVGVRETDALVRPGHTLGNIEVALSEVEAPPGTDDHDLTAFDHFVGYLLLDALVANRDRHEQNWAVLEPQLGEDLARLAPSYDHATSLGFNLRDDDRCKRIADTQALERFAAHGTAWRFEHPKGQRPPALVDLAVAALALASPRGRQHWIDTVRRLDLIPACQALNGVEVSGLSEPARTFISLILDLNLRRLRDAIDSRTA